MDLISFRRTPLNAAKAKRRELYQIPQGAWSGCASACRHLSVRGDGPHLRGNWKVWYNAACKIAWVFRLNDKHET